MHYIWSALSLSLFPCTMRRAYLLTGTNAVYGVYGGEGGILCVWMSGLLLLFRSICRETFSTWCLNNYLFMKSVPEWGETPNNMAPFPEFNWVQNCIDNLNSNESIPSQWKMAIDGAEKTNAHIRIHGNVFAFFLIFVKLFVNVYEKHLANGKFRIYTSEKKKKIGRFLFMEKRTQFSIWLVIFDRIPTSKWMQQKS